MIVCATTATRTAFSDGLLKKAILPSSRALDPVHARIQIRPTSHLPCLLAGETSMCRARRRFFNSLPGPC